MKKINNCLLCGGEYNAPFGRLGTCGKCSEEKWQEQKKDLRKEESKIVKESESADSVLNTGKESMKKENEKLNETKSLKNTSENITQNTERKIKSESEREEFLGSEETLPIRTVSPEVCPDLQEVLKKEAYQSVITLSDLNKSLFSSMKKIAQKQVEEYGDLNACRVINESSKQIINSMRLQLDISRFAKEMDE